MKINSEKVFTRNDNEATSIGVCGRMGGGDGDEKGKNCKCKLVKTMISDSTEHIRAS